MEQELIAYIEGVTELLLEAQRRLYDLGQADLVDALSISRAKGIELLTKWENQS